MRQRSKLWIIVIVLSVVLAGEILFVITQWNVLNHQRDEVQLADTEIEENESKEQEIKETSKTKEPKEEEPQEKAPKEETPEEEETQAALKEEVPEEEVVKEEVSAQPPAPVLNHTYTTRKSAEYMVSCPTFSFDYSDNWSITKEELDTSSEWDVLSNARGVTINYYETSAGFGSQYYGGAHEFLYANITKVADSSFVPGYPEGTDTDLSSLGKFAVAKIKVNAYEDSLSGAGKEAYDGSTYYAVVPESYLKETSFTISGHWAVCSFDYPGPMIMLVESPDGTFTTEEEQEIIQILSSFRIS